MQSEGEPTQARLNRISSKRISAGAIVELSCNASEVVQLRQARQVRFDAWQPLLPRFATDWPLLRGYRDRDLRCRSPSLLERRQCDELGQAVGTGFRRDLGPMIVDGPGADV